MNFSCDRCAKHYSLPDSKVPAGGFRATCRQCGNVFVVAPSSPSPAPPPPSLPSSSRPPSTLPPPLPGRAAAASASTAAAAAAAAAAAPADDHDRFFDGAPASHPPAGTDWHTPDTTDELVLSLRAHAPDHRPAIAIGVCVALGLVAAVVWRTGRPEPVDPASGEAGERRGGAMDAKPDERPRSARGEAAQAPVGAAELPPEPRPPQRGGPAATPDHLARAGTSIGRRDRKLLDLLDKKQDAPGMSAPVAGELSTGRASLDGSTVRGALASHAGAFSACIARAGKAEPRVLQGKKALVLELVVQPSGRVTRATMEDPQCDRTALGRCLVAAARRMVFPSFEGEELLVQAPLKLTAVQ